MLIILLCLIFSFTVSASPVVQGYKDRYYELFSTQNKICEYTSQFNLAWCLDVQKKPMGMYLGFKQLIVYSEREILGINLQRRQIKWRIPLERINQLHINYPVIVTLSHDRELTGYDYFTGFELWRKKTNYSKLFGSNTDLWMVSPKGVDKLDVVTAEVVQNVIFKQKVKALYGDDLFLFVEMGANLYHYNLINKRLFKVGKNFKILDRSSEFVLVGNSKVQHLRTISNLIISDNVKQRIFKVHTPTKTLFSYTDESDLYFISKKRSVAYQFTRSKNNDKMGYSYKLNDKIRVFSKDGQDVWKLKRKKIKQSDKDT